MYFSSPSPLWRRHERVGRVFCFRAVWNWDTLVLMARNNVLSRPSCGKTDNFRPLWNIRIKWRFTEKYQSDRKKLCSSTDLFSFSLSFTFFPSNFLFLFLWLVFLSSCLPIPHPIFLPTVVLEWILLRSRIWEFLDLNLDLEIDKFWLKYSDFFWLQDVFWYIKISHDPFHTLLGQL